MIEDIILSIIAYALWFAFITTLSGMDRTYITEERRNVKHYLRCLIPVFGIIYGIFWAIKSVWFDQN